MRALPMAALFLLAGVPCLAAEAPALVFGRGVLALSRLPPVLDEPTVTRHLDTGLTTVFLFTADCRGVQAQKGAAQVAIRYDLWDEVYHLEIVEAGTERTATVRSPTLLAQWWRSATLRVAPIEGVWHAPPTRAKLVLQVLPFSQAEQRDAQQWLLRSLRHAEAGPDAVRGSPAGSPMREFYGSMLASSIDRRTLISYSWSVPVVVEPR